jgi:hypothetical protein
MKRSSLNVTGLIVAVLLLLSLVVMVMDASAQSARQHPGYVDLETMGSLRRVIGQEPTIEVNVEGALLRLVAEASRYEDPELATMLRRLEGVFVRGFDIGSASALRAREQASVIGRELEKMGWTTIVSINERDEYVRMFARMQRDEIVGMVVMVVDQAGSEAIFLNIVGDVDPEEIGRIGSKFRVPVGN